MHTTMQGISGSPSARQPYITNNSPGVRERGGEGTNSPRHSLVHTDLSLSRSPRTQPPKSVPLRVSVFLTSFIPFALDFCFGGVDHRTQSHRAIYSSVLTSLDRANLPRETSFMDISVQNYSGHCSINTDEGRMLRKLSGRLHKVDLGRA
jgi:hypothetical protein